MASQKDPDPWPRKVKEINRINVVADVSREGCRSCCGSLLELWVSQKWPVLVGSQAFFCEDDSDLLL